MPVDKNCEWCTAPFKIKASHAHRRKFCSDPCRVASETHHGRPAAQKSSIDLLCKQCGNVFSYKPSYLTAYRKKYGKDPLYCSSSCFGLAQRFADDELVGQCVQCKKPMTRQRQPGGTINRTKLLCSTECRSLYWRLGYQARNPEQQPTRRVGRWGYIRLIVPGKNGEPSRDMLEHRYIMEQTIGRELLPEETVHHINGEKTDNSPDNLELFSSRHGPGQRVVDKVQFAVEILTLYPDFARQAGYVLHPISHVSVDPPAL